MPGRSSRTPAPPLSREGDEAHAPIGGPVRSCGACRVRCSRLGLLHFVVTDGRVSPDPGRRGTGRGLNLGPAYVCLERAAVRHVFGRSLGAPLPEGGIDGLARRFVADAAEWLVATLGTALARGGAERVPDLDAVTPDALRSAFGTPRLGAPVEVPPVAHGASGPSAAATTEVGGSSGSAPGSSGHALAPLPWLRVTSPRLARRVSTVASALSEFTTALAGDTTRRPRLAKACGVLSGAPGDEGRAQDAQRTRTGARGQAGRSPRSVQVVGQDE